MGYHYSDPERENDPHALPDVETFYVTASEIITAESDSVWYEMMSNDRNADADSLAGYYYWLCFPNCLPDGDPVGPFSSESAALAAAREE